MTSVVLVLVFLIILMMLGLALFFKDNLGTVFFSERNFIAGVVSVVIIAVSYVILLFPTSLELLNQLVGIFSTIPFMLAFFGGEFMLFLGLLIEIIILFFVIRAFLPVKKSI